MRQQRHATATAPVFRPSLEPLEPRALFAATFTDLFVSNITRLPDQQTEGTIAVDPRDPSRVFAGSNQQGTSMTAAVSGDGGRTWEARRFGDGSGADGLPQACCDPTAAFDDFGNLFYAYLAVDSKAVVLTVSTDAGRTFTRVAEFDGDNDQPTVAAGPGSVWVAFNQENVRGVVYGAPVSGLGQIGDFGKARPIGGPTARNVGDIAVGPAGQVVVAYQSPRNEGPSTVFVHRDADGLGSKKFSKAITATGTNVGDFDHIPAQNRRTVDAAVDLEYDRSGGPFTGRLYLAYTEEQPDEANNTDVMLRFSDDDGLTWSNPARVNSDATDKSQFLPRLAVDPTTGTVGLAWHDSRLDTGDPATGGGTNTIANDEAQFFAAVGTPTPGGVAFTPDVQVTTGFSNAALSGNSIDFGDYIGLSFRDGVLYPAWADNSNSTGDNPDGALKAFDLYAARLPVLTDPVPERQTLLGAFGDAGNNRGRLTLTDADGTTATITMKRGVGYAFRDEAGGIDLRLLGTGSKSSLSVKTSRGGDRRFTLDDVTADGGLRSVSAKPVDLTGTMSLGGAVDVSTLSLANVTGGTVAAAGEIRSFSAASLTDARVLSGADLGFAGGADAFGQGAIRSLKVSGSITRSLVAAGLDPVNGVFGDADDRVVGGAASFIRSISARGGADEGTRFVAGEFRSAKLPRTVDVDVDPRFRRL